MRVKYRLSDPQLAPWAMVWKRRLVAIYDSGVRQYNRTEITELFRVQIRIDEDDLYVNLEGLNTMYFEFHTSGMPVEIDMSLGIPVYMTAVIGVEVSAQNQLAPVAQLQGHKRFLQTDQVEPLWRGAQVQLNDEPVQYPGPMSGWRGYPRALYEAGAPFHSHSGVHIRSYHASFIPYYYMAFGGSADAHLLRDIGYDVPWMDGKNKAHTRRAYLTGTTDYPRASGIQTAEHILWGKREFAVYVDAFDQVSVFPTAEIGPLIGSGFSPGQNVPAGSVQMMRVPFPGWVYKKTISFTDYVAANPTDDSLGATKFPEIDWKLHPDGTKMCAVVYEQSEAVFDSAFFAPYATDTGTLGPAEFYPTAASFYLSKAGMMGFAQVLGGQIASISSDPWYLQVTGIIEVDINITLTGPRPGDFSLDLVAREIRRPTTTPYCTFLAGYVWHDFQRADFTKANPVYDARRGDLVCVDTELHAHLTSGDTATLYSLKNITRGEIEFKSFGGATPVIGAPALEHTLLPGDAIILSANIATLSFAMHQIITTYDDIDGDHRTVHPAIAIYVMNKYQRTLYPDAMPRALRAVHDASARNNSRLTMEAQIPGITLIPMNDLRGWGDPDLDSLREWYCRSFVHETYTPPIDPLANAFGIEMGGFKYYKLGARDFPFPSADLLTWYDKVAAADAFNPFPMFDITEPKPGWYIYTGMLMRRVLTSPHSTFFAHPNGTWAFFDRSFIYNPIGMSSQQVADGEVGTGTATLDPQTLEHCVFDHVHFAMPMGGITLTRESSFLQLYNLAIKREQKNDTLEDQSEQMDPTYKDVRGSFTAGIVLDSVDPTISYAELRFDWYPGFSAFYVERGYFTGTKTLALGYESRGIGGLQNLSLGAWFQETSGSGTLVAPLFVHRPITFSSCVLITF